MGIDAIFVMLKFNLFFMPNVTRKTKLVFKCNLFLSVFYLKEYLSLKKHMLSKETWCLKT